MLLLAAIAVHALGHPASVSASQIAVIMSANVEDYKAALRGFKAAASGHDVVAEYDMEGDLERGRKILDEIHAKVKPNLILAVGIWAVQLLAVQPTDIPVVYAMVLNPPAVVGAGTKNMTGASMNIPVEHAIRLFKQLSPQIRRIGVVYNNAKTGYLVKKAEAVAREEGVQIVGREIASSKDAIAAVDSMQDQIDALWILPDETVLAPAVLQHMLLFSYRRKLPLLGLSERHAKMGALLSLSFGSSEDIGRQAGELARTILAGKRAGEIPYTVARQLQLTVNLKAAQKLGLEIPKTILAQAKNIIQ